MASNRKQPAGTKSAAGAGKRLAMLAKSKGITQEALAALAGISQKTVSNLGRGAEIGVAPTLQTLEAVARALRVDLTGYLWGTEPPPVAAVDQPHLVARQVSRLVEDFLLSSDDGRKDILRLAEECAGRRTAKKSSAP